MAQDSKGWNTSNFYYSMVILCAYLITRGLESVKVSTSQWDWMKQKISTAWLDSWKIGMGLWSLIFGGGLWELWLQFFMPASFLIMWRKSSWIVPSAILNNFWRRLWTQGQDFPSFSMGLFWQKFKRILLKKLQRI